MDDKTHTAAEYSATRQFYQNLLFGTKKPVGSEGFYRKEYNTKSSRWNIIKNRSPSRGLLKINFLRSFLGPASLLLKG